MDYEQKTAAFLKRTGVIGESIIELVRSIKLDYVNRSIISQLVRSGTSIGANYSEAINASSKNDFRNKIFICKKETQETKHWLQMLSKSNPEIKNKAAINWKECQELIMIFQSIINSLKKATKNEK